MRALLVSLVLAVVVPLLASPAATATAPLYDGTVVLDGVTVRLGPHTAQVVTVNRTRGHHARVTFWARHDG
ncbi:MAG: hypothetical protein Q8O61_17960, partial [Nocardioides sp.]|nr:hypothetical protein [Nocardioides sp.]